MVPRSRRAPRTHSSTSLLVSPALCTGQCVTRGRLLASAGKSHSCETPTTSSIKPSTPAISVAAGRSETIRITNVGCLTWRDRAHDDGDGSCETSGGWEREGCKPGCSSSTPAEYTPGEPRLVQTQPE